MTQAAATKPLCIEKQGQAGTEKTHGNMTEERDFRNILCLLQRKYFNFPGSYVSEKERNILLQRESRATV